MVRKLTILALFVAAVAACTFGQNNVCINGEGTFSRRFGNYTVEVVKSQDEAGWPSCAAILSGPRGSYKIGTEAEVELHRISGASVTNTGVPTVVLHANPPGARVHDYWVVELKDHPVLYAIHSRGIVEARFVRQRNGRIGIRTCDAIFQYFEETTLVDSLCPDVFLEIQGNQVRDVSARHVTHYNKQIAGILEEIPPKDLDSFRKGPKPGWDARKAYDDWYAMKRAIIGLTLAYLYSGREQHAWTTLQSMWPADDFQRIKNDIMQTRDQGIVSKYGYDRRILTASGQN